MTNELAKALPLNVRRYRQMLRLRQEDVAKLIGYDRCCYNRMENGRAKIPAEILPKLANIFHVRIDILFQGVGPCKTPR